MCFNTFKKEKTGECRQTTEVRTHLNLPQTLRQAPVEEEAAVDAEDAAVAVGASDTPEEHPAHHVSKDGVIISRVTHTMSVCLAKQLTSSRRQPKK